MCVCVSVFMYAYVNIFLFSLLHLLFPFWWIIILFLKKIIYHNNNNNNKCYYYHYYSFFYIFIFDYYYLFVLWVFSGPRGLGVLRVWAGLGGPAFRGPEDPGPLYTPPFPLKTRSSPDPIEQLPSVVEGAALKRSHHIMPATSHKSGVNRKSQQKQERVLFRLFISHRCVLGIT